IPPTAGCNYYKYIAFLPEGVDRVALKQTLRNDHGVGLSGEVYELPLNKQPGFEPWGDGPLPRAEQLCASHICLPISAVLTAEQAEHVIVSLRAVLGRSSS